MSEASPEEMSTEELLDRVAILQNEYKTANDELTVLKAEVRRRMKVGDYADFTTTNGKPVRVSVQRGTSKMVYDVEAFRDAIDADLFEQITRTVIDDDLLYEAISANRIPKHLLQAPITIEKKGTPRVTITGTRRAV